MLSCSDCNIYYRLLQDIIIIVVAHVVDCMYCYDSINRGANKMTKTQIIEQLEIWVRQGRLTFDDLQTWAQQAYAKEAAQDEQE